MKVLDFLNIAKKICNEYPTRYQLGGVGQHEGNTFLFDCGGIIKSILWGFNFDYSQNRGGANLGSNGVPDEGCNVMFLKYCTNHSTDFNNIEEGELVWMDGHIGIYIGNRQVLEATAGWEGKVLISELGSNGERTRNGWRIYRWTHHGKCVFLDYSKPTPAPSPQPASKFNIGDDVIINGPLYTSSNASSSAGNTNGDIKTKITRKNDGSNHPYNTEGDLGWMDESSIRIYEEPKPIPVTELKVGDKVRIINNGNGASDGSSVVAGGIGWERYIQKIYEGRPYPYQVGNDTGTTGFYEREALEKI